MIMTKRFTKYITILLVAISSLGINAVAQSDSLDHYLKVAVENNPKLKADFLS